MVPTVPGNLPVISKTFPWTPCLLNSSEGYKIDFDVNLVGIDEIIPSSINYLNLDFNYLKAAII